MNNYSRLKIKEKLVSLAGVANSTSNPSVGGSNPSGRTNNNRKIKELMLIGSAVFFFPSFIQIKFSNNGKL